MSFFSEEDKINVFANTWHLSEVNNDLIKNAVLYAILSGNSIASTLLDVSSNQMSGMVDSFYTYAKEFYTLGLPDVTYEQSITLPEQTLTSIIAEDTNRTYGVIIDYHYVAPLVPNLIVAPYLITSRGWNPSTNAISVLPEEYQHTIGSQYFYEGSVDDLTFNDNNTQVTITYLVRKYKIAYEGDPDIEYFKDTAYREYVANYYFTDIHDLPAGFYYGRDYCVARYYVLDSLGVPSEDSYWWFYDISSGVYPDLIPENSIDEENNLLPVIPIRYQNQSMVREEVQDTDLYKTSKTLLDKIGISIDTVAEMIEENDNVDDIDHAYIMFGVDLQSNEIASIRYMAEFFDHIADKAYYTVIDDIQERLTISSEPTWKAGVAPTNKYKLKVNPDYEEYLVTNAETSWTASDGSSTTMNVTVNSALGAFEEYGLNTEISYSYIRSEIIHGSIGDIGHATKEWALGSLYLKPITKVFHIDDSTLTLKLQITENAYKRIMVKGLVHRNIIYDGHAVLTKLSDVIQDADEHNFIIPLHYNLSKKLPNQIRSQLYQDSLVLILNSYVKTSVSWYETGFFKFLTMAVTAVLTVCTGVGGAWLTGLTAAAKVGATAVLMYVLETVIVSLAISKALDYVAQWVGPEIMAILSVAVIAISGRISNIGAALGIAEISAFMPTAEQLLFLSTSMLSSANKALTGELEDVIAEADAFEVEKETKLTELEDALELIDTSIIDAEYLLNAQTYSTTLWQHTTDPEEFYDLAIHTGNPGVLSLSTITTFCDLALTLPEPDSLLSS